MPRAAGRALRSPRPLWPHGCLLPQAIVLAQARLGDEAKGKAEATCSWIAALTDSKTGKQKRKAYCRTKSKPPAKKAKDVGKT